MEGDIKDIVLARLEKRLKDKDDEIRALKDRINDYEDSDRAKALEARIERLEADLHETQTTLSEVMKKVGTLEAAVVGIAAAGEDGAGDEAVGLSDPDLALDGQSEPPSPEIFDTGVGAAAPDGEDSGKKDAMRFFRMGKNA